MLKIKFNFQYVNFLIKMIKKFFLFFFEIYKIKKFKLDMLLYIIFLLFILYKKYNKFLDEINLYFWKIKSKLKNQLTLYKTFFFEFKLNI